VTKNAILSDKKTWCSVSVIMGKS